MKFQNERDGDADDESDFIAAASALQQLVLASGGQLPASKALRQSFTTLQSGARGTRQRAVELSFSLVEKLPEADSQDLNSSNGGKGQAGASEPDGTNPPLRGVDWDIPISAGSDAAHEDEDEDEDGLVAAAAVLRKLTVGSTEEDPLAGVSPFSWEELEESCQQLDSSAIRIATMDLTCLLTEGGEEAAAAGTVLYNFELDAASAQVPAQSELKKHFSEGSMPATASSSPPNLGVLESTSSAPLPATTMSPAVSLTPALSPSLPATSTPPRATSLTLAPKSEIMPADLPVTLAPLNKAPSSNLSLGGAEDYWAHIGITALIPESMVGVSSNAKGSYGGSSDNDKGVLEEGEKTLERTARKPKKLRSKWVVRVTAKWLGLAPKGVGESI